MLVFFKLVGANGFLVIAIVQHYRAIILNAFYLPLAIGYMAVFIDGAGEADLIAFTDLYFPRLIDSEIMGGVFDIGDESHLALIILDGHCPGLGVDTTDGVIVLVKHGHFTKERIFLYLLTATQAIFFNAHRIKNGQAGLAWT